MIATLALWAVIAAPAADDRDVAAWALSLGAQVSLREQPKPLGAFDGLPAGPAHVVGLDFFGTGIKPADLARLAKLQSLKTLRLPAYMWNASAGVDREANATFGSLAALHALEVLDLSVHFLTELQVRDDDMEALGSLRNLKELRVVQGLLTGKGLAKLTGLQRVDFSDSRLTDEGAAALANMPNLERIILRNTLITDAGLAHLAKLRRVVELDLFGCKITDAGARHLAGMTRLERLNLLGANIGDEGLRSLMKLRRLRVLNLYRNPITNAGLAQLGRLPALRFLDVRYTRATHSGVQALQGGRPKLLIAHVDTGGGANMHAGVRARLAGKTFEALERWATTLGGHATKNGGVITLDLKGTAVFDEDISGLATFAEIETLNLTATEVSDLGLAKLAALPRLQDLTINGLRVSDGALVALKKLPLRRLHAAHTTLTGRNLAAFTRLQDINLADTALDDEGAKQLAALPLLSRLDVSYTTLGDAAVAKLTSLRGLRALNLRATAITPQVLVALATLTDLVSLDLSFIPLPDEALARLGPLTHLQELRLVRTGVGKAAMSAIAALTDLRTLSLSYTSVDDEMLRTLTSLKNLRDLDLESTRVSDTAVAALTSPIAKLNLLQTKVTEKGYERLRQTLPQCEILWDARLTVL
ncbi:MAG: hypothetical protein SF187_22830 [Deltaproteobacteria bacterium]|nr:hypothetical protein [Deltaproteobacteria bacterium]